MAETQPVLIAGTWRPAAAEGTFQPDNPTTKEQTGEVYPVSTVADVEKAVEAAAVAAEQIAEISDEIVAQFLERFADRIEARATKFADGLCRIWSACLPRLKDIELPRMTLRCVRRRKPCASAPDAARTDTASGIRSKFGALGGGGRVWSQQLSLAFNSVAGGDFAAAIAVGIPLLVSKLFAPGHDATPGRRSARRCRGDGYA